MHPIIIVIILILILLGGVYVYTDTKTVIIPKQDCIVSDWSELSDCTADACGTSGTQTRTRTILQESKSGGMSCPPLVEVVRCDALPCPVDCEVSDWSELSDCSAQDCGTTGTRTRTRTITRPPLYDGLLCPSLSETILCEAPPCPIDCEVSDWSPYTDCDAQDCGTTGTRTQTRTVIRDPQYGGAECPSLSQSISCEAPPCPVDCEVSDWSELSDCSAQDCGTTGTRTQTRTVLRDPLYGGAECPSLSQSISCEAPPCPVDCVLSDWSEFSPCLPNTCGTFGSSTQTRTRSVITEPQYGGKSCDSLLTETVSCINNVCPEFPCSIAGVIVPQPWIQTMYPNTLFTIPNYCTSKDALNRCAQPLRVDMSSTQTPSFNIYGKNFTGYQARDVKHWLDYCNPPKIINPSNIKGTWYSIPIGQQESQISITSYSPSGAISGTYTFKYVEPCIQMPFLPPCTPTTKTLTVPISGFIINDSITLNYIDSRNGSSNTIKAKYYGANSFETSNGVLYGNPMVIM
jgi:hypothetical protein